jgi:hypothetical protein
MSDDTKSSNPKDEIGSDKLPLHLVPSVLPAYAALAFTEGACKYGKYNWRAAGVRVSIYLDACYRHLAKYQNGEWADPVTHVPHLGSVLACVGIILDAYHSGKLTDDRPPSQDTASAIDGMAASVIHLKQLFEDKHPHQHTIQDESDADPRINRRLLPKVPRWAKSEEGSGGKEQITPRSGEGRHRPQGGREGSPSRQGPVERGKLRQE